MNNKLLEIVKAATTGKEQITAEKYFRSEVAKKTLEKITEMKSKMAEIMFNQPKKKL